MLEHTISDQSNDQVPEQLNLQIYSYNDASQDHADLYDPEDPHAAEDHTLESIKFDVEYDEGDKVGKIDEEMEETSSSWESVDEEESDGMDYENMAIYMVIAILFIGGLVGIYLGCKKSSTNKVKGNVDRKETIKLTETIKVTEKTDLNDVNIKTDTKLYDSFKKQEKQVKKMMKANKNELKVTETKLKEPEKKLKDAKGETEKNTLKATETDLKAQKNMLKATETEQKTQDKMLKATETELKAQKNMLKATETELKTQDKMLKATETELKAQENEHKKGCQKFCKAFFTIFSTITFILGAYESIRYAIYWSAPGAAPNPKIQLPHVVIWVYTCFTVITALILIGYIHTFGCPKKCVQVLHMVVHILLSIGIPVFRQIEGKNWVSDVHKVAAIPGLCMLTLYYLFIFTGLWVMIAECMQ